MPSPHGFIHVCIELCRCSCSSYAHALHMAILPQTQYIYVQHARETFIIPPSVILGKTILSAEFKPRSVLLCCSFTHLAQCSLCPLYFFPHPSPLFSLLLWFYFTLPPFPSHHRFESLKICSHTVPLSLRSVSLALSVSLSFALSLLLSLFLSDSLHPHLHLYAVALVPQEALRAGS